MCGFQGVGKTTLGKSLAQRISVEFFDTDVIVLEYFFEKHAERLSCKDIVDQKGEPYFRALEKDALASLKGVRGAVIALGGGPLDDEENRRVLLTLGELVYLTASYETVKKRSRLELISFDALYSWRRVIFESYSNHTIDTEGKQEIDLISEMQGVWEAISLETSLK